MKPWEEFANAMEESQRQDEIERTADCAQRYLYELCHKHAFAEVREILQHTKEYMEETIEVLEEDRETIEEQPSGFRATPHRYSA
jgi:lysyl-tRNA synthetase class I